MARYVTARILHDAGLATWFGGSLMGAVGLNGAAAEIDDPAQRTRAATVGWNRWAPVNAVGVGAHLVGAGRILAADRRRVVAQRGLTSSSIAKTALTAVAVGVTAWSGVLNRKMAKAGAVPARGATEPGPGTPSDVASAQRQLKVIQWAIPALTGGIVGVTALQGEQQRTSEVVQKTASRLLRPSTAGLPLLAVVAGVTLLARSRRRRGGRRDHLQVVDTPYEVQSTPATGLSTGMGTGTSTGISSGISSGTSAGTGTGDFGTVTTGSAAGTDFASGSSDVGISDVETGTRTIDVSGEGVRTDPTP